MKQYSQNRQLLEGLGNPLDNDSEPMDWSLLRRVDNYLAYAEKQYPQLKETVFDLYYNRFYSFIQIICNNPTIKYYIEFTKHNDYAHWFDSDSRGASIKVNDLEVYDCIDTMVNEILTVEAKNRKFRIDN